MFSLEGAIHLLENPWIKYGFFTFCATTLSLIIKFSSRRTTKKRAEDWAVGFDLAQVAIFALLTEGTADAVRILVGSQAVIPKQVVERLIFLPIILLCMFIVLMLLALCVRDHGWRNTAPSRKTTGGAGAAAASLDPELNSFGLVGPLILGVTYLIIPILWLGAK